MKQQEHKTVQHCSEDAITAYLLGMAERKDSNHVDACVDCYARVERARIQMEQMRQAAEKLGSHPEHFWTRQHAAIMGRIDESKPGFGYRWLWAPGVALAMLILVSVLLLWPRPVHRKTVELASGSDAADDALLTQIADDLQRPVPRALEPATLLVKARNDMAHPQQQHSSQGETK